MRALLFVVTALLSLPSMAHEYYFSYAEVEYNDVSRMFETSLVATTHDLEMALRKDLGIETELEFNNTKDSEMERFGEYILKHFQIIVSGNVVAFRLLGFETLPNGIIQIYLESEPVDLPSSIEWRFDLLMEHFPEQQNKATLYYRGKSYTTPFLSSEPIHTLKLD